VDVEQVIARWAEQEQAIRARLIAPGTASKEQIAGRTAMELFQGIFAGELPPAPIGDTLDFLAVHIEPGVAVFQGRPHRRHLQPLGHRAWWLVCHAARFGRWLRCALDSASRQRIHHPGTQGQHGSSLDRGLSARARRRQGDPRWPPSCDGRGPARRTRRQAVRARHHDLLDLRSARGAAVPWVLTATLENFHVHP
jgi:hypothetical protein